MAKTVESPYDTYLIATHNMFKSMPLSETLRNTLQLWWFRPNDERPRVMVSRRLYLLPDGSIAFQDNIQLAGEKGHIELNAEFDHDGNLVSSPEWEGDQYFEKVMAELVAIQNTEGSELSVREHYTKPYYFTAHDGAWVTKGQKEGNRPRSKEV